MSSQFLTKVNDLVRELNATNVAESYFSFINNVQRYKQLNLKIYLFHLRQLLYDNNKMKILNQLESKVVTDGIIEIYNLDGIIHQEHLVNVALLNQIYIDAFNQIMMLSPCNIMQVKAGVSLYDCQNFGDASVYQGMAVALTRHFENMRSILSLYDIYSKDSSLNFTEKVSEEYQNIFNDKIKNNLINILNTVSAEEISTIFIFKNFNA